MEDVVLVADVELLLATTTLATKVYTVFSLYLIQFLFQCMFLI